jgi:hypothetical protein
MRVIELDNALSILTAKQEVEAKLIEAKKLEAPMELQDFIKYLNLQNTIYVIDDTVIPFRIFDDMIFMVAKGNEQKDLLSKLEQINYDLTSLHQISQDDIYLGKLDKYAFFFIIDSKYYVVK